MILFQTPLVLVSLLILIGLHIGILFMPEKLAKIISYVNIALHIGILPLMLMYRYTIEEGVLVYMISVFTYTLASFIKYEQSIKKAAPAEADGKDEGGEASV